MFKKKINKPHKNVLKQLYSGVPSREGKMGDATSLLIDLFDKKFILPFFALPGLRGTFLV